MYNKYNSFYNLVSAKTIMSNDGIRFKAAEKEIREMWVDVADGVSYEDTSILYRGDKWYLQEFNLIHDAKFYKYLYENDLEMFYKDEVNNISFFISI